MNLGQDQIARSCSISQASVHRYLERADSAGLTWPLPEDHDDRRLNELLFPTRPDSPPSVTRPGLDFAEVHRQLQANRFVTLQLLWDEYSEKQSGGYGYSRSANSTSAGTGIETSRSGRITERERNCSSIGPDPRSPFTTAEPARLNPHRCSSPCSAPALIPSRMPREGSTWRTGSIATCAPLGS